MVKIISNLVFILLIMNMLPVEFQNLITKPLKENGMMKIENYGKPDNVDIDFIYLFFKF